MTRYDRDQHFPTRGFLALDELVLARGGFVEVCLDQAREQKCGLIRVVLPDEPSLSRHVQPSESYDRCATVILKAMLTAH